MLFFGCGVPNLDPPECSASRVTIREFYSLHFAGNMEVSEERLSEYGRYLSKNAIESARNAAPGTDPFTTGDADFPKAFRPGECRVVAPDRTEFDLLLFWRDDARSEQRTIKVETVQSSGGWQIDTIRR